MGRVIGILAVVLFSQVNGYRAVPPPDVTKVRLEVTRMPKRAGLLHWKISNHSAAGIYVYDFFLLGPSYNIEYYPGKLIFDTSPIVRAAICPNRVAPLVLLFVRSGGVIEGNFVDPEIKKARGDEVSLKIAVGSEPDTVVEEEKRIYNSPGCQHSPYDAVVNWATFVESNSIQVP